MAENEARELSCAGVAFRGRNGIGQSGDDMEKRELKQFGEFTREDLERQPVWIGCPADGRSADSSSLPGPAKLGAQHLAGSVVGSLIQ